MSEEIIVLKFGSSVLRTDADLPNAVHEIYRWVRSGHRVVAVISAIGEATDQLLAQAKRFSATPDPFATAELLATGERAAAAVLGIALDRAGVAARVLNPREIGLTVTGQPLDSQLVSVDVERLRAQLGEFPVLVVPGFFGTDTTGRTHLLGRGGSDLSAVFLAHALGARARLIKDVDGVLESDPADAPAVPLRRFVSLDYGEALRVAGPLIQPKAVAYLRDHGFIAEVAASVASYESTIHAGSTHLAAAVPVKPSRVLLLGLGTVGFGVCQRVLANAKHFECIGALVRDRAKYTDCVAAHLLHTDLNHVLALRPEFVVDVLPGVEPSRSLVSVFLRDGVAVVSANKALIADHGPELSALAREADTTLRYSAAVGGSAWMIETVSRVGDEDPTTEIAAVLNGTCNFVLDRCADGVALQDAIKEAEHQGFAESDPTEDLSGRDAARKLRILARHAFRAEPKQIEAATVDERIARQAREAASSGMKLRQVARSWKTSGLIVGAVKFERFAPDAPFGRLAGEWNGLEITVRSGLIRYIAGRGAGRWPTTEAVMADLFDAHRDRPASGR